MSPTHDRGGWPTDQPIDKSEHELSDWERRLEALVHVLVVKGVITGDDNRRVIESLPQDQYETMGYYERWAEALIRLMQEKSVVSQEELEEKVASLETQRSSV